MAKLLKPGQLCTIKGKVYRCSKRTSSSCGKCRDYYGKDWSTTPCHNRAIKILTCEMLFGEGFGGSFPILVSMCKK